MIKQRGKKEGKKIFWILLCTLFFVFTMTHEARAEYKSKVYTYNNFKYSYDKKTGYIWIRAYTGKGEEVNIPSQINGVPVKYVASLETKAEFGKSNINITKVYFPDGIEYIEGMKGCCSLESVRIPDSVKEIGFAAFQECWNLKSIKLPKNLKKIGEFAFSGCEEIKSIKFPKGLKSIGLSAFSNCYSLKEISIPDSVERLDEEAFSGCYKLRKVKLSKKMKIIYESTFSGCKKVKSIGEYAFAECNKIKSVTFKGKKVNSIYENAFEGMYSKVKFYVPKRCAVKYSNLLMNSQIVDEEDEENTQKESKPIEPKIIKF